MTNPKGTWAETAVVKWARDNGFPTADRLAKTGARDRGDVALAPALMVEVKNYASAGKRGPTEGQINLWWEQTSVERTNGDWELAFLVVRREFVGSAGGWWAYMDARDFTELMITDPEPLWRPALRFGAVDIPLVSTTLSDLAPLLRAAGWGDELPKNPKHYC